MSGSVRRVLKASVKPTFSSAVSGATEQQPKRRLSPLSLRLSEWERATLERLGAGRPLGSYIKSQLFDDDGSLPQRTRKSSNLDRHLLAQMLRALGRADIVRTIGDLHAACDGGVLVLSDEAELAVRQACADIEGLRRDLVAALGLKAGVAP